MFYFCIMEKIQNIKQIRIELICKKIEQGASIEEIIKYVNKKISIKTTNEISFSKRTIENDIKAIRKGEFIYSNDEIKPEGEYYFFIIYKKSEGKYYFDEKYEKPQFDEITEEERLTIPFLRGILKQYESIPAVKKVIERIDDLFEVDTKNKNAILINKAKLFEEEKIIELTIKLLGHIKRNECVQFHYLTVHKLKKTIKDYSWVKIIPIQVKIYENLYYLIGFDLDKKKLSNYRIDQIIYRKKHSIDLIEDEENSDDIKYFDPNDEIITSIDNRFKNTLGVWVHKEDAQIRTVIIKFSDWAANYVSKMKFHSTQKITEVDLEKNEITIQLELKLNKLIKPGDSINNLDPELAFLLGRFREYCEIIEIK